MPSSSTEASAQLLELRPLVRGVQGLGYSLGCFISAAAAQLDHHGNCHCRLPCVHAGTCYLLCAINDMRGRV